MFNSLNMIPRFRWVGKREFHNSAQYDAYGMMKQKEGGAALHWHKVHAERAILLEFKKKTPKFTDGVTVHLKVMHNGNLCFTAPGGKFWWAWPTPYSDLTTLPSRRNHIAASCAFVIHNQVINLATTMRITFSNALEDSFFEEKHR